jgi:hypothetical protein
MKTPLLLLAALLLAAASLSAQTTWQIGSPNLADVTATLSADGKTLTISGTGRMGGSSPWYDSRENITSITIEDGVTSLRGFAGCSSVASLTIPSSVTLIYNLAFRDCHGLTSITIPETVATIGEHAFYNCDGLTSVAINSASVGENTFNDCNQLASVTLGNGVRSIGRMAFRSCNELTSINIPEGVQSIAEGAFYDCTSLTSISIPGSVNSLGSAFNGCTSLTTIKFLGNKPKNHIDYSLFYRIPDNQLTLYYPYGLDSWTGYSYSGSTIINIEADASLLEALYDESLETIAALTADTARLNTELADCEASKLPTVWQIGKSNPSDVIATLSADKTTLTISGTGAMQDFPSNTPWGSDITTVFIEEGITTIGAFAFVHCANLTSINIPEGVTSIGTFAFNSCDKLTSVSIPEGVTSIGTAAFIDCQNLASLTIPSSLSSIGEDAFRYCNITKIVNLSRTPQPISSSTFADYVTGQPLENVALHVPFCAVADYKADEVWNGLGTITGINTEECLLDSIAEQNTIIAKLKVDTASLNTVILSLAEDTASLNTVILSLAEDTASLNTVILSLAEDTAELIADTVRLYELLALCQENSGGNAALLQIIADLKIDTALLNSSLSLLRSDTAELNAAIIILNNDKTTLMMDTTALNAEIVRLQNLLATCGSGNESEQVQQLRDSIDWLNLLLAESGKPIELRPMSELEVRVHPNPVQSELHITILSPFDGYSSIVELYDMAGARVYLGRIAGSATEHAINLSPLRPGHYILRVGNRMTKIVKQ